MAKHVWSLAFAAALALPVAAQEASQTVTVTGRAPPTATVSGFDDTPLTRAPFSATVLDASTLTNAGIYNLADIARLTSGLGDAYNANGYWSNFTVRGFVLDPRNNVRRDSLPINAETSLWLGNKQGIEVLRGTSGLQAGVSAPGGLVNLLVKRPDGPHRSVTLDTEARGTYGLAVDLGDVGGPDGRIGWRLNAEHAHLDPLLRASRGTRDGLAAALDWRLRPDSLLEAEVEFNRQSQPSQAGFSMLGNRVPDARDIDPRINLNNQPWSLPVVFTGQTASLRWTQRLADELMLRMHAMTQRLRTDDRIAFPFGCTAEGNFDRYCSDGSFDLYDYRSEGERRRNDALDVSLSGRASVFAQEHRWRAGVLLTRQRADLPDQAFNFVGTGTIDGQTIVAPDASLIPGTGTARRQRSTEWYVRDQWALPADASLWLGVRHTRLTSEDGGTDASQQFTTPWLGVTWQLDQSTLVYASAGQGIESTVAPNLPTYSNANQSLPALKSRQLEAGLKHDERSWSASATVFDVRRPLFSDIGPPGSLTRVIDGQQHHRGVELDGTWRNGPWSVLASATALHARRERSIDPANDGRTPVNVPERTARLQVDRQLLALPELVLSAAFAHEGERFVLPDDSARIPSWTRLDLAARLVQRLSGTTLTWRLGVDNATNRRAWRESPFQFGHVYLYPLAPRTLRASLTAAF